MNVGEQTGNEPRQISLKFSPDPEKGGRAGTFNLSGLLGLHKGLHLFLVKKMRRHLKCASC